MFLSPSLVFPNKDLSLLFSRKWQGMSHPFINDTWGRKDLSKLLHFFKHLFPNSMKQSYGSLIQELLSQQRPRRDVGKEKKQLFLYQTLMKGSPMASLTAALRRKVKTLRKSRRRYWKAVLGHYVTESRNFLSCNILCKKHESVSHTLLDSVWKESCWSKDSSCHIQIYMKAGA